MRLQICIAAALLTIAGCTDYEEMARSSLDQYDDLVLTEGDSRGTFNFTGINADGQSCAGSIAVSGNASNNSVFHSANCSQVNREPVNTTPEADDSAQTDETEPARIFRDPFFPQIDTNVALSVLHDDLVARNGGRVELWPTDLAGVFTYEQWLTEDNYHVGILLAASYDGNGSWSSFRDDVMNVDPAVLATEYAQSNADREQQHARVNACVDGDQVACGAVATYLNNSFEGFTVEVASAVLSAAMTGCLADDTFSCSQLVVALVERDAAIIANEQFGPVASRLMRGACDEGSEIACATTGLSWPGHTGDWSTALSRAQSACAEGDPGGCAGLAFLHISSEDPSRLDNMVDALVQGCELGDAYSCTRIDSWTNENTLILQDFSRPTIDRMFASRCDAGVLGACVLLGYAHLEAEPHGWPVDPVRAIAVLEPVCALPTASGDSFNACYWLGVARRIAGVPGQPNGDAEFQTLCDAGDERGCHELGVDAAAP